MLSWPGLMVPASIIALMSFRLSALAGAGFAPGAMAMRTFNHESPSIRSLPALPSITSLPAPPIRMSAPSCGLNTTASGFSVAGTPSRFCNPLIIPTCFCCSMLSDAGAPMMPVFKPPAWPVGELVPTRLSLNLQPERPSTRSKRSRSVNTVCVGKKPIPRSEFAPTGSPLWIAQSKPSMPLLRWMPGP